MFIHREGIRFLLHSFVILVITNYLIYVYFNSVFWFALLLSFSALLFLIYFFRNPKRSIRLADNDAIYAPADGRIVTLEKVMESEYFKEERLLISIFMSPTNVHVNRNPVSGTINYFKYHPGKYLVAWHPKSSSENERTTTVIDNGNTEIMLRQIAGAVAKRIVNYSEVGQSVLQGTELGFIKFGSRVDVYLPLNCEICVSLNEKVKGNQTIIAKLR